MLTFLLLLCPIVFTQDYHYKLNHEEKDFFRISCLRGKKEEFQEAFEKFKHTKTVEQVNLLETLHDVKHLKYGSGHNCININDYNGFNFVDLTPISELYRYGNWCGKNYGGFNDGCRDICSQNLNQPSDECIQCNPPIDFVDTQCMYHDFCLMRYQIGNYENSCNNMVGEISLGKYFPTNCNCAYNLTYHLRNFQLKDNCNTVKCKINGDLIRDCFDYLGCSCHYKVCPEYHRKSAQNKIHIRSHQQNCWETEACVDPALCSALHSVSGDKDEGIQYDFISNQK